MELKKYLILEGRLHGDYSYPDLLVSMERSHFNLDWNQTHEALHKEDAFMLNLRQYVDFLNLLKSGNAYDGSGKRIDKTRLDSILNEITPVRNPWRAEWLDSKFSKKGIIRKQIHLTYHKMKSDGTLEEVTKPIEECLMQDRIPGINLDDWLQNATSQGLPVSNTQNGDLHYWHPRNGTVAGFSAGSDGAGLDCSVGPSVSNSSLRVRAARLKKVQDKPSLRYDIKGAST